MDAISIGACVVVAATSATILYRYEIGDAHCCDLNEASTTKAGAIEIAALYARRRGHAITVYDRMAKHGDVCEWNVRPQGDALAGRVKNGKLGAKTITKAEWMDLVLISEPSERHGAIKADADGARWEWVSSGKRVVIREVK